jgi:predicted kinase
MACVYLLCGKTGSGKTSLARRLEAERRAFRLSLDELMLPLFGEHMSRPLFEQRSIACKEVLLGISERLLGFGSNVVLDWGFWGAAERRATRARLSAAGASCQLLYLELPDAQILQRLHARNAALPPGTYAITDEMFQQFNQWFEPPGADEPHERVDPLETGCAAH